VFRGTFISRSAPQSGRTTSQKVEIVVAVVAVSVGALAVLGI
jgi:hypothetical protein